jgi:hypothetical protein
VQSVQRRRRARRPLRKRQLSVCLVSHSRRGRKRRESVFRESCIGEGGGVIA